MNEKDMQLNEKGLAINCFAYMQTKNKCMILYNFYNKNIHSKCKGCPFFKTKDNYIKGLKI